MTPETTTLRVGVRVELIEGEGESRGEGLRVIRLSWEGDEVVFGDESFACVQKVLGVDRSDL